MQEVRSVEPPHVPAQDTAVYVLDSYGGKAHENREDEEEEEVEGEDGEEEEVLVGGELEEGEIGEDVDDDSSSGANEGGGAGGEIAREQAPSMFDTPQEQMQFHAELQRFKVFLLENGGEMNVTNSNKYIKKHLVCLFRIMVRVAQLYQPKTLLYYLFHKNPSFGVKVVHANAMQKSGVNAPSSRKSRYVIEESSVRTEDKALLVHKLFDTEAEGKQFYAQLKKLKGYIASKGGKISTPEAHLYIKERFKTLYCAMVCLAGADGDSSLLFQNYPHFGVQYVNPSQGLPYYKLCDDVGNSNQGTKVRYYSL
jgi:hypothetical protein